MATARDFGGASVLCERSSEVDVRKGGEVDCVRDFPNRLGTALERAEGKGGGRREGTGGA